jgi:hypothetical protein
MKSHKSNFWIVIEMLQSIHIQYMIRYFIKLNTIIWSIFRIYLHFAMYRDHLNFHKYYFLII